MGDKQERVRWNADITARQGYRRGDRYQIGRQMNDENIANLYKPYASTVTAWWRRLISEIVSHLRKKGL